MNKQRTLACAICADRCAGRQRCFLVCEDRWQDKLRILHWDDYLAAHEGMYGACNIPHLQELVIHWMTMGHLDHPFARTYTEVEALRPQQRAGWTARNDFATHGSKPIGELSVHRESMQRVLNENPQSLQAILDALLSALQKDVPPTPPKIDWESVSVHTAMNEI